MSLMMYLDYCQYQIKYFTIQDGQKLISTEHIHLEYQDGKCTLTIDKVTLADEAEYMCEAKNDAGVATTWAELLVESGYFLLVFTPLPANYACVCTCITYKMNAHHLYFSINQ